MTQRYMSLPTIGAIVAGALAILVLVSSCGAPAYASPTPDSWPPKVGDTVRVSVLCDARGHEALTAAFEADMDITEINAVYADLLSTLSCLSIGDNTVAAIVTDVSEPMFMSSGDTVYALTVRLPDGRAAPFYTFIIGHLRGISI